MRQASEGSFLPPAGLLVVLVLSKLWYKDSLTSAEPAAETLSKPLEKSHYEQAGQMAYSGKCSPCTQRHESGSSEPVYTVGVAVCACSPNVREAERGGSLGLAGQLVYLNQ